MITINYEDNQFQVKNNLEELTIKEFENVCAYINDEKSDYIDKWINVFVYLGIPQEVVDEFDATHFKSIIEKFNLIKVTKQEIFKELIIDDLVLIAYDEKFKLTVKELSLIESYCKNDKVKYIAEVLAVIYKNPEVEKSLRYDKSHLKYKAELIRTNITAEKCVPILEYISKQVIKDFTILDAQ